MQQIGGMPRSCRLPSVALAALSLALITACSAGGQPPAHVRAGADPATVAQVNARLLRSGVAPGFLPLRPPKQSDARSARDEPFAAPQGTTGHVCTLLMSPVLFAPSARIGSGQYISVANPQRYGPIPPSWFEWIDVYPGTESSYILKTLPSLIGKCGHFMAHNSGAGPNAIPVREAASQLTGLGDQALYVSVRAHAAVPGGFLADDWVVIRSKHTLIWISGQNGTAASSGQDRLTLLLAHEAWRHFSAD
jgi:hypothetical protein